ncbi:MAG: hypothetical protein R3E68_16180 [Burkholderiaceae bacterium]
MTIESLPTFTKPARQRWESIPADIHQRLLSNVWCGQCRRETTITNFFATSGCRASGCSGCMGSHCPELMLISRRVRQ